MTAIISASGDPQPGSPMTWLIFLMDETQNWTFTQNVTYSGQLKTAEWIVEAPGECTLWVFCSITDLADYGSVSFDAFDFVNSNSPSLSSGDSVTMVQGGKTVSTPSDPDGDRDGFTVMFGDQKPFPPGPLDLHRQSARRIYELPVSGAVFRHRGSRFPVDFARPPLMAHSESRYWSHRGNAGGCGNLPVPHGGA